MNSSNFNRSWIISIAPLLALVSFLSIVRNGPDYFEYLQHYKTSAECFECVSQDQGIFFTAILYLFSINQIDFEMFCYALASTTLAAKIYVTVKILPGAYIPSILFYISSFFILHELIQIRLSLALAVAYLGIYYYLILNKRIIAFLLMIASVFIHTSLVVLWISAAIYLLLKNVKVIYQFLAASLVFIFLSIVDREFLFEYFNEVLNFDYSSTAKYAYELIGYAEVSANYVSIYSVDAILTAFLAMLLLGYSGAKHGLGQEKIIKLLIYFVFFGFMLKTVTISAPVVSFRLFELFTFGLFALKGWAVHLIGKKAFPMALVVACLFLAVNLHVFAIKGPF